jgi:hypothetical protein
MSTLMRCPQAALSLCWADCPHARPHTPISETVYLCKAMPDAGCPACLPIGDGPEQATTPN